MPSVKLTSTFLDRDIKIPKKDDLLPQVDYFDKATTGFGVRVSYNGTKAFFVMGRVDGRKIRCTIKPSYDKDIMPLDKARKKAKAMLTQIADGVDPKDAARADAAVVETLRADTYGSAVTDFVEKFHKGKKKNRHWAEPLRLLLWPQGGKPAKRDTLIDVDDHLWKGRAVSEITKADVIALLDDIIANGKGYTANRVYAAMNTFFKWSTSRDRIVASPMKGVDRPFDAEEPRKRVFDETELKALWNAADCLEQLPGAFLKLMLLTGKRRGAVAAMRWDEIGNDWVWTPSADKQSRNKRAFKAPLPPLAQRVLSGLPTVKGNPHVFVGRVDGEHLKAGSPLQGRIKKASGIDDFLFHSIRHTVETKLAEGWDIGDKKYRVPPHIRDLVLDHVPARGSGADYDHYDYEDEIKEALENWAERIESLIMPEGVRALR